MSAEDDLLVARICVMILLPGITFVLGMLPTWLSIIFKWDKHVISGLQGKRAQFIFSKLLCFAGGVLMATVFMHLLPSLRVDCEEQVTNGNLPDAGPALPWAEFLLSCGFFFVYLVEEAAHAFVHWQSKAKHPAPVQPTAPTPCIEEIQQNVTGIRPHEEHDEEKVPIDEETTPNGRHSLSNGHGHSHSGGAHSHIPPSGATDTVLANVRNIMTILALSFHCIFEGIAVGMEETAGEVWYLFGAISTHKFVIAICVGIELLASKTKRSLVYTYVFIFGFVSAVGIIAGWLIATTGAEGADKNAVTVTMQGMAAGTIVYVTFFEILQREKSNNQNGFLQLASIILGFATMVGMMSLAPDP
ncbi:zinc transporter ZIP1-like [Neocloeon triangulifer]|uniref:zinc transporter ZIP1-like n=1 Tax=Neocloeon triangulifer TaxID=2078957 RepID=UPI00286F7FFE|nr:zinc transporter ZIP1-like [Neocloeon triangulifer]